MAIKESRIDDIALSGGQNHQHKGTATPCTGILSAPQEFDSSENYISSFSPLKSLLLPLFIRDRIVLNNLSFIFYSVDSQ
jgi:hypothetical protein